MKERRKIFMSNVYDTCISHNWYTCGNNEEYDYMLAYVNSLEFESVTTDELEIIATNIKEHSDTDYDIKNIMFVLANECCTTFIEE